MTLLNHLSRKRNISRVISHKFADKVKRFSIVTLVLQLPFIRVTTGASANFFPPESLTVAKGFLDSDGAVEATARVVADFPTCKPCSMGGNKKLKRECKKTSKAPVNADLGEADLVVCSLLGEVLEEVVVWGCNVTSEEDPSSSTEEQESEGDSGESESSENQGSLFVLLPLPGQQLKIRVFFIFTN